MADLSETKIIERLNGVFAFIFDDDSIRVTRATTSNDIEDWDSLTHVTLIGEVEEEFGFKFTMKEVVGMQDVGEMIDIIAQRAKK